MYKFFKRIGLVLLVIASFIYTERATLVVKEYDKLMIDIKNKSNLYKIDKKEAIIKDNTIIPGITGKTIDIDKSYSNMKFNNKFDENLIIYKLDYPKNRIKDNMEKYIIKTQKEEVSVIIKINNIFDKSLLEINDKVSFYMNNSFIKKNIMLVSDLVDKKYTILNNQNNYIKNMIGQKATFCMIEFMDNDLYKECIKNKSYIVVPNIIVKNNYTTLNQQINGGSIILTDLLNYKNVLKIIKNKGYKIVSLSDLLSE